MERKDYSLEIVDELLKKRGHIRGLAERLRTNHTMVLRRIKELEEENVVDYDGEGRNKVYFLKKTLEARAFVFRTESYKLSQLLKKYPTLRAIIEKVQRDNRIRLAVLFGSYAKGKAKPSSDVDIYIGNISKEIKKELGLVDSRLSIKIGKYDKSSYLIKEIEKYHVIIKGIERFYEKNNIFE